jgi:hypothetical protein
MSDDVQDAIGFVLGLVQQDKSHYGRDTQQIKASKGAG